MEKVYKDLFDGLIDVFNEKFYLGSENPENLHLYEEHFRGQNNTLCGASIAGCMLFATPKNDSTIHIKIHLCGKKPKIKSRYKNIVEVSFLPKKETIYIFSGEEVHSIYLPSPNIEYRVRYSVINFDEKCDHKQEKYGRHLIELWPQETTQDKVVKNT